LLEESQSLYENASILFTESSDNIPNRVMDWDRFTWIYPNSEIKIFRSS